MFLQLEKSILALVMDQCDVSYNSFIIKTKNLIVYFATLQSNNVYRSFYNFFNYYTYKETVDWYLMLQIPREDDH